MGQESCTGGAEATLHSRDPITVSNQAKAKHWIICTVIILEDYMHLGHISPNRLINTETFLKCLVPPKYVELDSLTFWT